MNCNFKFAGPKFLAYNPPKAVNDAVQAIGTDTVSMETYGRVAYDKPYNMVRGIYGNYVGIVPDDIDHVNCIVNLYIPGYNVNNLGKYFKLRYQDSSAYQSISDYIALGESAAINDVTCYRGDCFISWYTHRVNRNFND